MIYHRKLTEWQKKIANMYVSGQQPRFIARQLGAKPGRIEAALSIACKKLGVARRQDLRAAH